MTANHQQEVKSARKSRRLKKILVFPLTRILVGCIVCLLVSQLVNVSLKSILGLTGLDEDLMKMIRVSLNIAAMLAAYCWLFKRYEKRTITELALKHLPRDGITGFLAAGLVISIVILILFGLGYYQPIGINGDLFVQLYSFVIITSMAAAEEILMRGILYRITEASLGTHIALVVSGLAFGLAHLSSEHVSWFSVVLIALGGVVTGLAFSASGRLWVPIFVHAGWNFAQAFFGTILSGMEEYASYGFIRSKIHGPELLTGGTFGPENSVITMGLLLVVSIWVYSRLRKNGRVLPPFWRRDQTAGMK